MRLNLGTSFVDAVAKAIDQQQVDVVGLFDTYSLIQSNRLLPLSPLLAKQGLQVNSLGPDVATLLMNGELFELPYAVIPRVLVYNRDLFETAGVPLPQPGWTWEEFREKAQRLTQRRSNGAVTGLAAYSARSIPFIRAGLLHGSDWPRNPAAMKETLQFFAPMVGTAIPAGTTRPGGMDDFWEGKAAMGLERGPDLQYLRTQAKFRWDMVPYPGPKDARPRLTAELSTFAISAKAASPEGAWRFLSFASGPEGALTVAKAGLLPRTVTREARDAWFAVDPRWPPGAELLFQAAWELNDRTQLPTEQELKADRAAATALNKLLTGEKSWDQAFAEYAKN